MRDATLPSGRTSASSASSSGRCDRRYDATTTAGVPPVSVVLLGLGPEKERTSTASASLLEEVLLVVVLLLLLRWPEASCWVNRPARCMVQCQGHLTTCQVCSCAHCVLEAQKADAHDGRSEQWITVAGQLLLHARRGMPRQLHMESSLQLMLT